ncbi:helix-turn-helix domain-containing protein [Paenibacillus sp. MBLB4367]|uniref:helix-turn-helix domain-containing protein n=1 Tax=Paenibacillus sp. MBLB4367 TaxID=3384767 RepID=UPI0039081E9E
MDLPRLKLSRIVNVDNIISFHYAELPKSFRMQDCYDFWQMFYVDKGEWEFYAEPETFAMSQGDCLFVPPDVIRRSQTKPVTPPNVMILSFECRSAAMRQLARRTFRLHEDERHVLSQLIREGNGAFLPPPLERNRRIGPFRFNEQAPLGSKHMVRNYLEILLVSLLRRAGTNPPAPKLPAVPQENREKSVVDRLLSHIEANVEGDLSIRTLCRTFAVSRTHLYEAFKKRFGCGISDYVRKLRSERAKVMIREETNSMTEIAERLGYSSIHYFSKDFKKMTGMTPSDYARSMQALVRSNE